MAQFYASNKLEKMGKRKKRNLSFVFRFLISREKLIRSKKKNLRRDGWTKKPHDVVVVVVIGGGGLEKHE